MYALKIGFFALAVCMTVLAVVFTIAYLWIRRLREKAVVALREDCGEERVYHVADCNYFGVLSSGLGQVRGNGLLALTAAGLRFRMLSPKKTLFIPLRSITGISQPRSFLKKTKARELLRVDFINGAGEEDAAAWLLRDLRWWSQTIESLRSGGALPSPPVV